MVFIWGIAMQIALGLSGCKQPAEEPPTAVDSAYWRVNPNPNLTTSDTLSLLVREIQGAPDVAAEASAIQRLHDWEAEKGLTYQVSGVRVDTNRPVESISAQPYLVRVDVSIFRGQAPIYNFSFVPRDNRNVALLGK